MIRTLTRSKLLKELNAALAKGHVLLEAPAGYGKTLLLQQLARHRPHSHLVSLTPADGDLAVLRSRLEPLLQPEHTLLLDDVHQITGGTEAIAWLQEQMAREPARFVLAGRGLPFDESWLLQAPVTRWAADRLAFAGAESRALLPATAPAQVARWHEQLAGWPLGMGLLARLPAGETDLPHAKERLFRYLAGAVFAQVPDAVRRFLHVTAVPLRFDDELAAHLLGDDEAKTLREEVERRNLFLYPDPRPGWFHYHDLIREYLLAQVEAPASLFTRVVRWHEAHDDLESAIEHALAGGLHERAAALMATLPDSFLNYDCRYLTYRRWVRALDAATRDAHPVLLRKLGLHLHYVQGFEEEARTWLERALRLSRAEDDASEALWTQINLARIDGREGYFERGVATLRAVLASSHCTIEQRHLALRVRFILLGELARFRAARRVSQEIIALARAEGDERQVRQQRQNLAISVLLPLGKFERATAIMQETLQHFTDSPSWHLHYLLNWCDLCYAKGEWQALAAALQQADELHEDLRAEEGGSAFWLAVYRAALAVARGEWEAAQSFLHDARQALGDVEWGVVMVEAVAVWALRRRGQWTAAVARAERVLETSLHVPFERAKLALERDLAQGMAYLAGDVARFRLHPETRNLIRWHSRAELVRLRALLALVCRHDGDPRWRRHVRAARYATNNYAGYEQLLTRRDPDLGAHFWRVVLAEGMAVDRAQAALVAIGQHAPLLPLLHGDDPAGRVRAAQVLAAIGDERAMPPLNEAVKAEEDAGTKQALGQALAQLENAPPPPLHVELMGAFRLRRGEAEITAGDFPRPVVLRLFHYFALHRGQILPRDRILEDLWPDKPHDKAWATFRTVYSRLRTVLEPYVRRRGPCRYVAVEGEAYRFDPLDVVTVDAEQFEQAVRGVLREAETAAVPPLPDALLEQLRRWQPLLPDLPYEDWLVETRQRLLDTYVEGCLYVAQTMLQRARPGEAIPWAQRAIDRAPWLEAAYQVLMRAHARQGQRTLALKVYQEATQALSQELDIAPSPLTDWLRRRLERGQSI